MKTAAKFKIDYHQALAKAIDDFKRPLADLLGKSEITPEEHRALLLELTDHQLYHLQELTAVILHSKSTPVRHG